MDLGTEKGRQDRRSLCTREVDSPSLRGRGGHGRRPGTSGSRLRTVENRPGLGVADEGPSVAPGGRRAEDRDECLNEHWFTSLEHAQAVIEGWRREYNEERPKKGSGELTPAGYAQRLVADRSTVTVGL